MSAATKAIIGGVIAVVLVAVGAFLWWQRAQSRPSSEQVKNFLATAIGAGKLRVASVDEEVIPLDAATVRITFRATTETTEPLYTPVDTRAFLQQELGLNTSKLAEAEQLLRSKAAPRLREIAGPGPTHDPMTVVVLKVATPLGTKSTYAGALTATRAPGGWQFQLTEGAFTAGMPTGNRRPAASYLASDTNDTAALKTLVTEQEEYATRLLTARKQYDKELQDRRDALIAALKPGALFSGLASNREANYKVSLEIVAVKTASRQVSAMLRNDGGWREARRFEGRYDFVPDEDVVTLTLATRPQDAVRDAGPLLQNNEAWQLAFRLSGAELTAGLNSGGWEYRLQLLSADDATAFRNELQVETANILAATAPGKLYHGVAITRDRSQSFSYHLRFVRQESDGAILTATLEPDNRDDRKRPFKGTIIGNRYKSNEWPLRLESRGENRVPAAEGDILLGNGWDFSLLLKLEGDAIIGESDRFTFKFEPATPEYIAEWQQKKTEREQRLTATTRPGASYIGYLRSADGQFSEKIQVLFKRIEQRGALLEFSVRSLDIPGVFADLRGTLDMYSGQIVATKTGGHPAELHSPLLRPWDARVIMTLGQDAAEGIVNDTNWKINFTLTPAAPAASVDPVALASTPAPSPVGATAVTGEATAAPSADMYPRDPGAYVWIDGTWKPLPHNGGKVTYGAVEVLKNVNGLLAALSGKTPSNADEHRPDKLADLTFTGNESVPVVDGTKVIIAYVGALKPVPPDLVVQYPELNSYPAIELALSARGSDGSRKAPLYRIVPGIAGFRETRVPATFARVTGNVSVLTCTGVIGAGRYAVAANEEAYELIVR